MFCMVRLLNPHCRHQVRIQKVYYKKYNKKYTAGKEESDGEVQGPNPGRLGYERRTNK